ncbi:MAG: EAL domain-containing protein [Eubacteriales bacterium]|nr:EAL domain-containing protein [Eubacteriales bacterium]
MNITAQICGLALLTIIIIFYHRGQRLALSPHKVFNLILIISTICITLDILSVVAICNIDTFPYILVVTICKMYLLSLVSEGSIALIYSFSDIYHSKRQLMRSSMAVGISTLIIDLIIIISPINIVVEKEVQYTEGPAVIATYLGVVSFIFFNLIFIFIKRKQIYPRRRMVIYMWLSIWITAAIVQFINNRLLLVGFAVVIGIAIIYIRLENPEYYIDKNTGFFNQQSFYNYVNHLYENGNKFSLMITNISRDQKDNMDLTAEQNIFYKMAEYVQKIKDVYPFKISDSQIILMFTSNDGIREKIYDILKFYDEIGTRYEAGRGDVNYVFVPDDTVANDASELMQLINYAHVSNNSDTLGNYIVADNDALTAIRKRKEISLLMSKAIEGDRIEVFYQPIYNTTKKKFSCAEALVRMRDEDRELIPPGMFIPLSESNGMIVKIGEIVFEKTCKFITDNELYKLGVDYIEVNLSVVQCAQPDLADRFIQIMDKYKINPKNINLEITESASMSTKKYLLENMQKLIDYGVHFSLDDFGTGQSNLNYIVDMPVDIVKFDKDMINAYFVNDKARHVMTAAMNMIKGMELEIVSEGIETKEQLNKMEDLGIDYIQGFYFSKPLSPEEYIKFLKNANN